MTAAERRLAEVNGIALAYDEAGTGPLVLLVHGWPEIAHSWRNQIPALASAGYRVVAPDDVTAIAAVLRDLMKGHAAGRLVPSLQHDSVTERFGIARTTKRLADVLEQAVGER